MPVVLHVVTHCSVRRLEVTLVLYDVIHSSRRRTRVSLVSHAARSSLPRKEGFLWCCPRENSMPFCLAMYSMYCGSFALFSQLHVDVYKTIDRRGS